MTHKGKQKRKISLEKKLVYHFFGLVVGIIILVILFNAFMMENLVLRHKQNDLHRVSEFVSEFLALEDKNEQQALQSEIQEFINKANVQFIATDLNSILINTDGYNNLPAEDIRTMIELSMGHFTFDGHIEKVYESPGYVLRLHRKFEIGNTTLFVIADTSISTIEDNIQIFNGYMLLSGGIILIIGFCVIVFFSHKITRPVVSMNQVAQNMINLDFSEKAEISTMDEIGELGMNINALSSKLEDSLNELREANEKLKADLALKEKIDAMRKQFISNVSHEIKTPLSIIMGYAEAIRDLSEDSDVDEFANIIIDESSRINQLNQDLLRLSQIESGLLELERSTFDLSETVHRELSSLDLKLKTANVIPRVCIEQETMVSGDEDLIALVLRNFLSNALNHVDENKEISVTANVNDGKVRLSVFNSGAPIPPESKTRLWDSFYKVDKARTREYGGSGLGLSIARSILQAHTSVFGFENHENGVEFFFELPITE